MRVGYHGGVNLSSRVGSRAGVANHFRAHREKERKKESLLCPRRSEDEKGETHNYESARMPYSLVLGSNTYCEEITCIRRHVP